MGWLVVVMDRHITTGLDSVKRDLGTRVSDTLIVNWVHRSFVSGDSSGDVPCAKCRNGTYEVSHSTLSPFKFSVQAAICGK